MIPNQRHRFELPDDVAYLNCAYLSPLMKVVKDAGVNAVARRARPWEIAARDFFTTSESVRTLFARIVSAMPGDIAIVPAVSYGIATAARNVPIARGQSVVLLAEQFPSNVYAWREAVRNAGGQTITVARPADGDWTGATLRAIGEDTAVVALANCHWTDGSLLELVRVGMRCREVGAALVLDLTQSAGAMPFDVNAVQPDFAVAASYKWLLGPYSLAFLYVAPRWQSGEPLEHNWIAREHSEDFAGLVDYCDDFQPGARRFDMGERSNFQLLPMAEAALGQILEWGVAEIAATLGKKTASIAQRAAELALEVAPADQRAGHFAGLRFEQGVPSSLLERLAAAKVCVSVRGDSVRVTPHLYNTDVDIGRFLSVLASVR
ncbi:MAG: aminotransferase class V-fold PLP-dependent enzyme [Gammaproteobacteria bacterium]|nr:MAG: aminotransferase class V-fold PLP-dependent enzyme [Gammaproteobacteria bacterium]